MEITVSELKKGVEVDMPVDWKTRPSTQNTIKYHKEIDRFVLADIKTGAVHVMFSRLPDLVDYTNKLYKYDDIAVEE